jgi:hypothetical protein
MKRLISSVSAPIEYIPFYHITKDMWNMHTDFLPYPGYAGHSDCVHFCYHPMMWMPVWKALLVGISSKKRN